MHGFLLLVGRDLRLGLRQGSDAAIAVVFFLLTVVLFPLGIGPEPQVLGRIAAGIVWVAALLSALLTLERLFQSDLEDGSLELLSLTQLPLEMVVLAKASGHWLMTGLPVVMLAPVLALLLQMDGEGLLPLVLSLLVGTPCLSLLGAIGAALVLGARRGGPLVALLILPLYIPILIFGAGAVEMGLSGLGYQSHLMFLGGFLAAALPLAPLAAAAALRHALE